MKGFSMCGPQSISISMTRDLLEEQSLRLYLGMTKSGTLGLGPSKLRFNKPCSDSDACQGLKTTALVNPLTFRIKS